MTNPEAKKWLAMAGHRFYQGHYAGAIDSLKHALALDPELARAHGMLSICLHETGRLLAAMEEAEIALKYDANDLWSLLARGMALASYHKYQESEAILKQALSLNPDQSTVLRYLSVVVAMRGDEKGSGELLERGCKANPNDSEMWSSRGIWCIRNGKWEEGEHHLKMALSLNAEHAFANQHMGVVLVRKGHRAEAREHILLALRGRPNDTDIVRLLMTTEERKSLISRAKTKLTTPFLIHGWTMTVKVLIVAYMAAHFLELLATDLGHPAVGAVLRPLWAPVGIAAFVVTTSVQKKLMREVADVQVRTTY